MHYYFILLDYNGNWYILCKAAKLTKPAFLMLLLYLNYNYLCIENDFARYVL